MPNIFINGIPLFTTRPTHLRDIADVQDVEYEEIYEPSNINDNENIKTDFD